MWPFKEKESKQAIQVNALVKRLDEMLPNASLADQQAIRSRLSSAISGTNFTGDTLHAISLDYGYPESLQFVNFWNMYRRFGIAKNIVELIVDACWMRDPIIDSTDVKFLREVKRLVEVNQLWTRLKGLDKRQRVGRYAGLFMRVRDNQTPDKPLDKARISGIGALVNMIPLYEGQLEVLETENSTTSDNYGLPTMYQFNSSSAGGRNEKQAASFSIHPSRIVIAAEGADNGGIYGISSLEAPYNSLMDLRKIIGGAAEGFYKNAAQSLIFSLKDGASAKSNESLLERFNESTDDFLRNRPRRSMWTPGMDAKILESSLANPKEPFDVALSDVAASAKTPATIIIGQQTGRLASSEDSRSFLSMANSRNENFTTGMITDILRWCIIVGILPAAKFEVEWDDLLALSQEEQLDNADKMADINQKQFLSGGGAVFEGDEIREAAGFDPEDEIDAGGEDIDDNGGDDVG